MTRRSKQFAAISAEAEVPGYFSSLNVVTFPLPSGKQHVFDFSRSADQIGPIVGEFGAAFARICSAAAHDTRKTYAYSIRAYFRYHAEHFPGLKICAADIEGAYLLKYASWLRKQPLKACTLDAHYRTVVRLLEDINARTKSDLRIPKHQFPHASRSKEPKRPLHPREIEALIRGAKTEARNIWADFQASRSGSDEELALVRSVAQQNGGLLPVAKSMAFKPLARLLKQRSRVVGGYALTAERWRRSLCTTSSSLIPFIILIMYDLAGNSEAIVEMSRDCLSAAPDIPILAGLTRVEWSKARSRARQYQYRGAGEFSAPTLIRQVLEMTEPLVQFMPPHLQDRLFLYCSEGKFDGVRCHALGQTRATQRLKDFGRSIGIRPESGSKLNLCFEMIRPTRLTVEYLKSGSIFRVKRLANHKYLTTTSRYLDNTVTAERDAIVIANLQSTVLTVRRAQVPGAPGAEHVPPDTSQAALRSFACKDPYRGALDRCPQWLRTLLDESLIVPDEPYYVARVWQARHHLETARDEIDHRRFEAIYLDALLVTTDILSHFSAERLAAAQELLPSLSAMPRIT